MYEDVKRILNGIHQEDLLAVVPEDELYAVAERYEGKIFSDGDDVSPQVMAIYYLAYMDVLDKRIYKALALFDQDDMVKKLLYSELYNFAKEQNKLTEFVAFRNELLTKRMNDKKAKNKPKDLTLSDVEKILDRLAIFVGNNLITKRTEISGEGADALIYAEHSRSNAEDVLINIIQEECQKRHIGQSKGNNGISYINNLLNMIADKNRFNPVLDMFKDYKNSNEENFTKVVDVLNLKTDLEKTLFKKWLIQTVAVANNNDSNDTSLVAIEGVLTLQGPQALGKTTFCRKLSIKPEWFVEGADLDTSNKDSKITALSGFITELGELDATMKRKQPAIKAFITRPLDRLRYPFARRDSYIPRITSFVATVNPENFLKDETGNRRYWVLDVSDMDKHKVFSLTESDMKNMWGYAAYLYEQDKTSYRLTEEELEALNKRNREYEERLPYEMEITELFDFEKDKTKWAWYSPSKIARVFSNNSINAERVGKVISKLMLEHPEIEKRRESNCVKYLLPKIDDYLITASQL